MFSFSLQNNLLPSGEQSVEGYSITIEQATRHQAGIYQCVARNGVGEPVTESIALHVLCKFYFSLSIINSLEQN